MIFVERDREVDFADKLLRKVDIIYGWVPSKSVTTIDVTWFIVKFQPDARASKIHLVFSIRLGPFPLVSFLYIWY